MAVANVLTLIGKNVALLSVPLSVGNGTASVDVVDTEVEGTELVVLAIVVVVVVLLAVVGMVCDCVVVKWGGIKGGTGATIGCGLPDAEPVPVPI